MWRKQQRRRAERGTHLRAIEVLCAHPKGRVLQTISSESGLPKKHGAPAALQPLSLGYAVPGQFLHALSADDEDVRAVQQHRQRYGYHVRCKAASGQAFPAIRARRCIWLSEDGVDICSPSIRRRPAPGWAACACPAMWGFASPCTAQAWARPFWPQSLRRGRTRVAQKAASGR